MSMAWAVLSPPLLYTLTFTLRKIDEEYLKLFIKHCVQNSGVFVVILVILVVIGYSLNTLWNIYYKVLENCTIFLSYIKNKNIYVSLMVLILNTDITYPK